MSIKKTSKFDFEATLKKLESIVNLIEKGGLNLEESLKLFSEGVMLTKKCQEAIKRAERKVKILTGENLTEFNPNFEDEENNEGE
ncbi:MAG: exodeoxyribonuclease VII small subunit [Coxiellaceae bacterium]|jgi:exodeoxyribonuclease VII small subunit|nr:exodeoxyribonuclease VII small subunit [Coxiellaceae bacterium]